MDRREIIRREFINQEYMITYNIDDTLEALGLTLEQVQSNIGLLMDWVDAKRSVEVEYNMYF